MMVSRFIPGYPLRHTPNILRSRSNSSAELTPSYLPTRFPGPYGPQYRTLIRAQGIARQVTSAPAGTERSIKIQIKNELYQDQNRDENSQMRIQVRETRVNKSNVLASVGGNGGKGGNCPECEIERARNAVTIEEIFEEPVVGATSCEMTKFVEVSSPSPPESEILVIDLPEESNNWVAYPRSGECKITFRRESVARNKLSPTGSTSNNDSEVSSSDKSCALIEAVRDLEQGSEECQSSEETTDQNRLIPARANTTNSTIEHVVDINSTSDENLGSSSATDASPTQTLTLNYDQVVRIQNNRYFPVQPPSYYAKQHWKKIMLQMFIRKNNPSRFTRKNSNSKKELLIKTKRVPSKSQVSQKIRKRSLQGVKIIAAVVNDRGKILQEGKMKTIKTGQIMRCLRSNTQQAQLVSLPQKCKKYM